MQAFFRDEYIHQNFQDTHRETGTHPRLCCLLSLCHGFMGATLLFLLAALLSAATPTAGLSGCDGWCTEDGACDPEDCGMCCSECFSSCFDCTHVARECGAAPAPKTIDPILADAPEIIDVTAYTAPVDTYVRAPGRPSRPPPSPPRVPATSMGVRRADYWVERNLLHTNAWWDPMASPGELQRTQLIIKGASWSGLERRPCMPGGASDISLHEGAALMRAHNLNAVRLPLAVDGLLTPRASPATCLYADGEVWLHNSMLAGSLEYIEVVAKVSPETERSNYRATILRAGD